MRVRKVVWVFLQRLKLSLPSRLGKAVGEGHPGVFACAIPNLGSGMEALYTVSWASRRWVQHQIFGRSPLWGPTQKVERAYTEEYVLPLCNLFLLTISDCLAPSR